MSQQKLNLTITTKDQGSPAVKSFQSKIIGLTKSLGTMQGIMGVAALGATMAKFGQLAQVQQGAIARLDNVVKTLGGNYKDFTKRTLDATAAMQNKTVFGDEAQIKAITDLTTITGDYEGSLKALPQLLDFATSANMDLGAAAKLYGRALDDDTAALIRYFPMVKKLKDEGKSSEEIMQAITERTKGSAEAFGKTQPLTQFTNVIGDLGEVIGNLILPIFTVLTKSVLTLSTPFVQLANGLSGLMKTFGETDESASSYATTLGWVKDNSSDLTEEQKKLNDELEKYQDVLIADTELRLSLGRQGLDMTQEELDAFKEKKVVQDKDMEGIIAGLNKLSGVKVEATDKEIAAEKERVDAVAAAREAELKIEDAYLAKKFGLGQMSKEQAKFHLQGIIDATKEGTAERLQAEQDLADYTLAIQQKATLDKIANIEKINEKINEFNDTYKAGQDKLSEYEYEIENGKFQFKQDNLTKWYSLATKRAKAFGQDTFAIDKKYNKMAMELAIEKAKLVVDQGTNAFKSLSFISQDFMNAAKASAIAQSLINTYQGVTKAYADGGILGFATGAAVLAAGLGAVHKITSTSVPSFQTDTGQTRRIPAPAGVPVPIIAHGDEIIGRAGQGGGGGDIVIQGNVFDLDGTISVLREGFYDRSKLDGLPIQV